MGVPDVGVKQKHNLPKWGTKASSLKTLANSPDGSSFCKTKMTTSTGETPIAATSSVVGAVTIRSHISNRSQWRQCHHLTSQFAFVAIAFIFVFSQMPIGTNANGMSKMLEFPETNLTVWTKNVSYISSTSYNARGMKPFYNLTNEIIKLFIGPEAIPKGYLVVSEMDVKPGIKVERNEWGDFIKHYWAILLVVIVVALLVVLMPIIGLCFCCCRCAGACGGRSQPFDKKHDTCRRVFLGLLLICAATGLLFGVIISFATNNYMQDGIDSATRTVRSGSYDTQKFLDTTSQQINHLLVNNYRQLSSSLENILTNTAKMVIEELENQSKAITLTYLSDFMGKLPEMQRNLTRMKTITNELRVNASQLSDGLRGVKRDLLSMLMKCKTKPCKDVLEKYEIGSLDANGIDYNQIPDVTDIIDSVENLVNENIGSSLNEGGHQLQIMRNNLNDKINQLTPQIMKAIRNAGNAIELAAKNITQTFTQISNAIGNNTNTGTKEVDQFLEEYSIYRFYMGVAISSTLLLVLASVTAALFCGICGKRPDGYGDDCCNKGSGSRFLMLAIAVMFLTFSVLALIALGHFLVGVILQRGVCIPLQNPETDDVFQYIDNFIDLNNHLYANNKGVNSHRSTGTLPPFRISHIIMACQKNQTIYEVLRLHNHMDIQEILEYPNQYKINESLRNLIDGIDFETTIVILNPTNRKKILGIKSSALKNFDSDKFSDNLNASITKHSLNDIAQQLRGTANNITATEMSEVHVSMKNQALHLKTYQENLVDPMTEQSIELIALAKNLEKALRYEDKPFEESIDLLVQEIDGAQNFIQNDGLPLVKGAANKLTDHFSIEIDKYFKFVVKSVQENVGNCGPLANVYNAGVVGTCQKIVEPFNGFWAGVAWCVILFLPTIVISVKLSSLYQKSDPYPGPLVESEYLYDAYSERDILPLPNRPPRSKPRKSKERRRGSRDRRGDYFEDSVSSHGATGGSRDTRYNDMAPKHWDGGPPRYQNPPMAPPASEYERPPPYYYPGASDQD